MNRRKQRQDLFDKVLPYFFTSITLYESILEFLQMGWARNILKPLLTLTVVLFFHVKTKEIDDKFRNLLFYGFLATFASDVCSIFAHNAGIKTLHLIISTVSYLLFTTAFTINIMDGKISTGLPFIAGFAAPYLLIGTVTYFVIRNNIDGFKLTIILYMISLFGMGIQSAIRNFNTTAQSFTPTALGAAAIVLSESAMLVIQFKGLKWGAMQALAVFFKNMGRFSMMKGCIEHIDYFFIQKKELLGQSLFGPAQGGRIKQRPKKE